MRTTARPTPASEFVDAGPARRHVHELFAAGLTVRAIALRAGVTNRFVEHLLSSTRTNVTIRPDLEAAILAVRSPREAVPMVEPAETDDEVDEVDEVKVDRACDGARITLTAAEKVEAVRRLTDRGLTRHQIGQRLRLSGSTVLTLLGLPPGDATYTQPCGACGTTLTGGGGRRKGFTWWCDNRSCQAERKRLGKTRTRPRHGDGAT